LIWFFQVLWFDVKYVTPADNKWGKQEEDGSWNGMIGLLNKTEVDICTAGLSITMERQQALDYTMTLANLGAGMIIQRKSAVALNYWVYVDVFNKELWIGIAILMFIQERETDKHVLGIGRVFDRLNVDAKLDKMQNLITAKP
jgi:ABC-type amino acid transport substrate-binding protein